MNDTLKQLFTDPKTQHITTPDAQAKARAMAAALNAYDELHRTTDADVNSQDHLHKNLHKNGRDTMTALTSSTASNQPAFAWHRWVYSGLASAAVLVLAVSVVMNLGTQVVDDGVESLVAFRDDSIALPSPEAVATLQKAQHERDIRFQAMQAESSAKRAPDALRMSPPSKPSSVAAYDSIVMTPAHQEQGRDRFTQTVPNAIQRVSDVPVSAFSIDVDTSSYSFVRRQLNQGVLPQKAAVRLEEMVNYFPYDYPLPDTSEQPFSTSVTILDAPWKAGNKLIHIGIQGYDLAPAVQPRSNLVFLLDVSGSMNSPDKLPLVKQSLSLLLSRLNPEDTVAIAVYASAAGTVLEPTPVKQRGKIIAALDQLQAGGSTAGGEGIKLAYQLARSHFVDDGVNRIILATDGDFNVGIRDVEELKGFVERQRETGVFLSILGFGQGNYHDQLMQTLAQNGNGVAAYIDSLGEAQKVLVDEATSSLFPIAKDVKIQVEFNPATVSEYRLLGYETRLLDEQDFHNDAVDAGDIGAGHAVTAIYEITPVGQHSGVYSPSRYQRSDEVGTDKDAGSESDGRDSEYGFLQLRYKLPDDDESRLIQQPISADANPSERLQQEAHFATAVAGFAQLLQGGQYTGQWGYQDALTLAQNNRGQDLFGYRSELVQLIRKAEVAEDL